MTEKVATAKAFFEKYPDDRFSGSYNATRRLEERKESVRSLEKTLEDSSRHVAKIPLSKRLEKERQSLRLSEEALEDFSQLDWREKYLAFKRLEKMRAFGFQVDVLQRDDFFWNIKPHEVMDRLKGQLIKGGGEGISDLAIRYYYFSEDSMVTPTNYDPWQDRYILASAIFYLRGMDAYHTAVRIGLQEIYKETADATGKSPLFDTDDDGYFDTEDALPLNENYHSDADGDGVPDELDYFPSNPAQYLGASTLYEWYTGNGHYVQRNPDGSITLGLSIYFDTRLKKLDFAKWVKEINHFFDERIPEEEKIHIRVSITTYPEGAHHWVKIKRGEFRSTAHIWTVDLFKYDIASAAHEVMHLFGLPDRYHEMESPRDHTFSPGRDLLVDGSDLMKRMDNSSKIDLRDLRLLAAAPARWSRPFTMGMMDFDAYRKGCEWHKWEYNEEKMTRCVLSQIDRASRFYQQAFDLAPPRAKVLIEEKMSQARNTKEDEAQKKPGSLLATLYSDSLKTK